MPHEDSLLLPALCIPLAAEPCSGCSLLAPSLIWWVGPLDRDRRHGIRSTAPASRGATAIAAGRGLRRSSPSFGLAQLADAPMLTGARSRHAAAPPSAPASRTLRQALRETLNARDRERCAASSKAPFWRRSQCLYELPWYMFIGAPGSGKTTALLNAGLHVPAGREDRARQSSARRRRHAQLRLVVHRRGGADRHRRPLHHAGIRAARPTRGAGTASSPCCEVAAAPADQRRAADRQRRRTCCSRRRPSARSTRPSCARACRSCTTKLGVRAAGLRAGHQDRPDRRLQRDFGDARQGGARAGLGLQLPAATPTQQRRRRCATFDASSTRWSSACAIAADRPHAGRARRAQARRDLRLPAAVRGIAAACSATSSSRSSPAARLDEPAARARRLLHQRHAGRHADRPRAGHAGAHLRRRARPARAALPGARQELLPAPRC